MVFGEVKVSEEAILIAASLAALWSFPSDPP
jgi:hypothetical protein